MSMEFLVTVKEIEVKKENVCVFVGETEDGPLKFTITKKNIKLTDKVVPGTKLSINASLKLRETIKGDKVYRENTLYVNEI